VVLIGHTLADGAGRLLAVDPRVCEIMQREERELVGMMFEAITHPDDRARNVAAIMALRSSEGPLSMRKRYIRQDGSAVWSQIQVSRLNDNDGSKLVGTIQLLHPEHLKRCPEGLWKSAKRAIAAIEQRRVELTNDLFQDYAWLILLHVYLAEAEGREADLSIIAKYASMRSSIAGRWLNVLEERGLIERSAWTDFSPQLTALGIAKLERLLDLNLDL
jgi:PAS domain S-box-containing protein